MTHGHATKGAFGSAPFSWLPDKKKKVNMVPRKLAPPAPVQERLVKRDKDHLPANRFLRFIKQFFFGEGI